MMRYRRSGLFAAAIIRDFLPRLANTIDTEMQFNGKRCSNETKQLKAPDALFLSCCSCCY